MNLSSPTRSLTAQFDRFSLNCVSYTSIRCMQRYVRSRKSDNQRDKIPPKFEPGHGEKIWIFSNYINGITVYSHDERINRCRQLLDQVPFNGKKLKPLKMRGDEWRPLALIEFPEGQGEVGRSVMHMMRELRKRHDLDWPDSILYDEDTHRTLTKHQRGLKLNDQKANSVADIAAVLGGVGKGNHIWQKLSRGGDLLVSADGSEVNRPLISQDPGAGDQVSEATAVQQADGAEKAAEAAKGVVEEEEEAEPKRWLNKRGHYSFRQRARCPPLGPPRPGMGLVKTTIWWWDEQDKNYAESWPANVTHGVVARPIVHDVDPGVAVYERLKRERQERQERNAKRVVHYAKLRESLENPPTPAPKLEQAVVT